MTVNLDHLDEFLTAMRRRETLLAWLRRHELKHRSLPDDYPGHEGGVWFEIGDEGWCADYHPGGAFKVLSWA